MQQREKDPHTDAGGEGAAPVDTTDNTQADMAKPGSPSDYQGGYAAPNPTRDYDEAGYGALAGAWGNDQRYPSGRAPSRELSEDAHDIPAPGLGTPGDRAGRKGSDQPG